MTKSRILVALVLTCILMSCGDKNVVFKENESFGENYEWAKSDKKSFTIHIDDNKTVYSLVLNFRYASSYMYDKALLRVTETDPRQHRVLRDVEIPIRDEKGEFIGDKGYDIIDLAFVLDANKKYPTFGDYTYTIEQTMPNVDPLNFAMEVGIELKKRSE